jgi:hypothetical protein
MPDGEPDGGRQVDPNGASSNLRKLGSVRAVSVLLGIALIALPVRATGDECLYMATPFSDLLAVNTVNLSVDDLLPRSGVVEPAVQCASAVCSYEIAAAPAVSDIVIGDGRAYIARGGADFRSPGDILVVNLRRQAVEHTISVGNYPADLKIAGGKLYVASTYSHRVDVIDLATFETSFIEGFLAPMALAVSPDESRVFVGAGRRLDVIDTSSDQIVDGISLREGPGSRIGPASTLAIDGELLVVGVVDEVRGYDLALNHRFTIPAGYLVSEVAVGPGNRLYVSTDLTYGWFLVGSIDPPGIYREIDLEPDLRVTRFWGDVRVASSGRVFVAGGPLYVIDPLRLAVTRKLLFDVGGCTVEGTRPSCGVGGGAYMNVDLAPCPDTLPTLTPTRTASPTLLPSCTPTASVTPTVTTISTPTATITPTPASTPTNTPSWGMETGTSSGGCSLRRGDGQLSWMALAAPVVVLLRKRRHIPGRTRLQGYDSEARGA